MPRPSPSNNMPWPENLIYDFKLSSSTTPETAEAFLNSIPTKDRNKEFLRLRYIEGKSYKDIAGDYGVSSAAVYMAIKYLWEK